MARAYSTTGCYVVRPPSVLLARVGVASNSVEGGLLPIWSHSLHPTPATKTEASIVFY